MFHTSMCIYIRHWLQASWESVEVKIGKISILRSLKNKFEILFFKTRDGDPIRSNLAQKISVQVKVQVKVPFVGSPSHEFKNKIFNLFFNDLRNEIFPIFTSTKLSDCFSLKSHTPKILAANVVYK